MATIQILDQEVDCDGTSPSFYREMTISIEIGPSLRSNVYVASSPDFEQSVDAESARFAREIGYYNAEMQAYSRLEGHEIGQSSWATLPKKGEKLHALGLIHRDVNKHNFLITEHGPVLIDFVTAEKSNDTKAMEAKLEGLEKQFLDELGIGSKELEEGHA
ncbi:uncharacterized protein RSE6_06291 [Rhynchosporium secalis]|uniref:Aminoglycoside phosphotransferase domain-containing protein n=1 Tax=Rhynchosporium secalis TaxID=38038 RepID=A0A1E1M9Z2_RHYSE|nr:uncharacterized protein RSE6_06291 [Rhynchosporium secalis]